MSTVLRRAFFTLGFALLASCTSDTPSTAPTASAARQRATSLSLAEGKVNVCHHPGRGGKILEVNADASADHLGHGDYFSTLLVSHEDGQPDDGSHFVTIGAAIAAASTSRAAAGETLSGACRITILVSAGTYQGTIGSASGMLEHFPLIVDAPDITLHGALEMTLDAAARATGEALGGGETVLSPVEPLPFVGGVSTPVIIANAHPDGSAGNGLAVTGFVFQSGHNPAVNAGGQGILSLRVSGLTIRGNRFEGGFTESMDLRAGSADVIENHLAGTAGTCDLCVAGPGSFRVAGNRLLAGGIPGISISPTVNLPVPPGVEPYVLPATAEVWADVRNNEVRGHQRVPVGVGIRLDAVGVGAPNVSGNIHATVQDNSLLNNRFGMIVHGAFPTAITNRRGDLDLTLGGNVIEGSCKTDLYVAFVRHTTPFGLSNTPYLLNSTFQLTLNGDVDWNDAWFAHPVGFGNTLVVDGEEIGNATRHSYTASACAGS